MKNVLTKNYVVNESIIKLLPKINIDLLSFIILIYYINDDTKKFDVDKLTNDLQISKEEAFNGLNTLIEKKVVSLISRKDKNNKIADFVSFDQLNLLLEDNSLGNSQKKQKEDIYSIFEKEFGRTITAMEYEIINAWIEKDISEELIVAALKEAVYNGVSNFRYIDKVLYEWGKKGFKNASDVDDYLKKRNKVKDNNELFDYNWIEEDEK